MKILMVAPETPENRRLALGLATAPFGPHSVKQACTLEQGLADLKDLGTDVLILELDPRSRTPQSLIEDIRAHEASLPIILLSEHSDHALSVEALRMGAQDVLPKDRLTADALSRAARYALERTILTRELRERDEQYRRIVESAEEGIWTIDARDRTLVVNPKMSQLLGYRPGEMIGKSPLEFVDEENRGLAVDTLTAVRRGEIARLQIRLRRKDGSPFWAGITANPAFDEAGRYQGALALVADLGDRRDKEEALHRLAALVDSSADAIITLDLEGNVTGWNPAAERLYGYSQKDALGRSIRFVAPPDRQVELDGILCRIRGGEGTPIYETTRKHRDGHLVAVSVQVSPVRDCQGRLIAASAIVRDISAQQKLQSQFRQAQKMEAVGRLAGGVAHDFNNLLTVINGYSQLIVGRLPQDDPIRADAEEILRAGERAAGLTRQLLAFSRKQVLDPQVTSLNPVIRDLGKMLQRLIGEDIQISTTLQADLGNVRVDLGQMEQVLMNLVVNARDAMPQGGRLLIETRNVLIEKDQVGAAPVVPPGAYVLLSVTDTGVGMDKEVQSHLFEPFFTTKGIGKGTGLGLSTIYGIVRQSGGFITVYSEPGKGSCFQIYLPNTSAKASPGPAETPPVASLGGSETVLVVEDSEVIRRLACEILTRKGYRTRSVPTAEEALETLSRDGAPDLLLTDLILSGMNGLELCRQAARQKWGLKRLVMTGYTEETLVQQGLLDLNVPLLHKPFGPTALLTAVRKALGGPVSSPSTAGASSSA